jgi:hypothetical protein
MYRFLLRLNDRHHFNLNIKAPHHEDSQYILEYILCNDLGYEFSFTVEQFCIKLNVIQIQI